MSPLVFLAAAFATEPTAPSDDQAAPTNAMVGTVAADPGSVEEWPLRFRGQAQPSDAHYDLELMYVRRQFDEGLAETNRRLDASPTDVVLHWMKVRFLYEVGERFTEDSDVDRVAFYREMLAITERGLELCPDDSPHETHLKFARGIAMGRLGTSRGILASLFMAKDVEADWLAVADHPTFAYSSLDGREMLPCDAQHALGMYYRLLPDWWIVKVLAGTRGSLDKSLAFHKEAVACKPDVIENWKELAATQYCIASKRKDDAMRSAADDSVARGLAIPLRTDLHRIDHEHLKRLREDPSLGCGYSRDGQQELDEKKLDKAG